MTVLSVRVKNYGHVIYIKNVTIENNQRKTAVFHFKMIHTNI